MANAGTSSSETYFTRTDAASAGSTQRQRSVTTNQIASSASAIIVMSLCPFPATRQSA